MTKDEALKLALEALEEAWYHVGTFQPTEKAIDLYDEARTAIKEALAQTEQKPVPPPWWPAVENILAEYGLQAIDFVADFKNALAQPEQPARPYRLLQDNGSKYFSESLDKAEQPAQKNGRNF